MEAPLLGLAQEGRRPRVEGKGKRALRAEARSSLLNKKVEFGVRTQKVGSLQKTKPEPHLTGDRLAQALSGHWRVPPALRRGGATAGRWVGRANRVAQRRAKAFSSGN